MTAQFTYMGTKRLLAGHLAELCAEISSPGPFLDLFSGISAAGSAVAPARQIWCNDVQSFSAELTRALYTSQKDFSFEKFPMQRFMELFSINSRQLSDALGQLITTEHEAVFSDDLAEQVNISALIRQEVRGMQAKLRSAGAWCLFSTTHSGSYFSLQQAADIDSMRFAADRLFEAGSISEEVHRWAILGICRAISNCSNSTGHFAQYLSPSITNVRRVTSKRRKSIIAEWENSLREMSPRFSSKWRVNNRVFSSDAAELLCRLKKERTKVGVIYADPPYTDDQYSRFYHILENVVLYDYPVTHGKGEYRPDRFVSNFSLRGRVDQAFQELIDNASAIDAALVISYPSQGLMANSSEKILAMLAARYSTVHAPKVIPHLHSTLGASKGKHKQTVNECIFIATH